MAELATRNHQQGVHERKRRSGDACFSESEGFLMRAIRNIIGIRSEAGAPDGRAFGMGGC
jgi:hypothetical protein